MPLFWPWHETFSSPLILISGIRHKDLAALWSLDNLWACTYETLAFGAITLIPFLLWKLKRQSFPGFAGRPFWQLLQSPTNNLRRIGERVALLLSKRVF